jgi:hypothetical protein
MREASRREKSDIDRDGVRRADGSAGVNELWRETPVDARERRSVRSSSDCARRDHPWFWKSSFSPVSRIGHRNSQGFSRLRCPFAVGTRVAMLPPSSSRRSPPVRHLHSLSGLALLCFGGALLADPPAKPVGTKVLTGKVVAHGKGVALDTGERKLPLTETDVSRKLFLDPVLHGCPVELTVREKPGQAALDVTQLYTLIKGKRHEAYYWCDNCQLRAEEPGPCKCCGGDTRLVEVPVAEKKK